MHGVVEFAEGRRERRLTDEEYRQLGKALLIANRLGDVWKLAIAATWLMILTGWWRSEVLGLRWSLANSKTGESLRPLAELVCTVIRSQPKIGDVVFPGRSGEPIVGYRKMWLRIAKLGDLPTDVTPDVLRHSFASLAADLGVNEPTIASLLGHETHSITSRYVHSANTVLVAAADAVANATQSCGTESRLYRCFRDTQDRATDILPRLGTARGPNSPLYRVLLSHFGMIDQECRSIALIANILRTSLTLATVPFP